MKERLVTLVCALGALALFLAMFLHGDNVANGRGGVPSPTSEERRGNGYHGAMTWLDLEHVKTVSVRDRFDKWVARAALPATGNLLIVTLPAVNAFRTEEFRPLDNWVRSGNTLLVPAALSDEPDWAFAVGRPVAGDLSLLTGLEFETVRGVEKAGREGAGSRSTQSAQARPTDDVGARIAATSRAFAQPRREALVPNGAHPYFEGVQTAVALSDYPSQAWAVKIPYDGFVFSLAREETGEAVLWTRSLGKGRVIVSGLGSLFTNRALGLGDNARLLANIVGATVGPRGAVLFDDLHQGLGAAYDPAKFYSDRRLYETVGILAALWLCWVLGSTRLQLLELRESAPREAELVQATGGFLARVLTPAAGALGLFEHFFRRVREQLPGRWRVTGSSPGQKGGVSPGGGMGGHAAQDEHADAVAHGEQERVALGRETSSPPWAFLRDHPRVEAVELRQLRCGYDDARAGRRVPLDRLHNLIQKIHRHITA